MATVNNNNGNQNYAQTDGTNLTSVFHAVQGLENTINNKFNLLNKTLIDFEYDIGQTLDRFLGKEKTQHEKEFRDNKNQAKETQKDLDNYASWWEQTFAEQERKRAEYLKTLDNTIQKAVTSVFKWGVTLFTSAVDKVQRSYLDNFSNITARMNLTASEYTKMYRDTAQSLRSGQWRGLNQQFDTADFATQLQTVLSTGLRGSMAQDKAMYDLIAKKLVPSIDTNSRSFVLGYRKLGEDFTKVSVGLQRLNTNLGKNMEYFESGLYGATNEQMMEFYLGNGGNTNALQQLHQFGADFVTAFGQTAWNSFFGGITSSLNSPTSSLPFVLAGYATSGNLSDALTSSPETVSAMGLDVIRQQVALGESVGFDRTALSALAQAGLIFSPDSVLMMKQYLDEFENDSKQVKVIDSIRAWGDDLARLRQGEFASETEKFDKMVNNSQLVVDSATFLAEHIPSKIQDLISVVISGFASIAGVIITNRYSNDLGSILRGLLTKEGGGLSGLFRTGSVGASATEGGSVGIRGLFSGQGMGGATSGLGKALGGAGILAGALWAGIDAYNSGTAIAQESGDLGKVIQGVAGKFILGSDYSQRSLDYQLANAEVDWGEVLSTAGKGALVGGGAGMMASPVGGLIGTAAGGISAGITNLFTQLIEKGRIKEYVDNMKKLTQSTTDVISTQNTYADSISRSTSINELLNVLQDKETYTLEEREEAFEALKDEYPTIFGKIKDISKVTEDHIKAVEKDTEALLRRTEGDYRKAVAQSRQSIDKMLKGTTISGGLSEDVVESIMSMVDDTGHLDIDAFSALASSMGINATQLAHKFEEATGADLNIKYNQDYSKNASEWTEKSIYFSRGWKGKQDTLDTYRKKRSEYYGTETYDALWQDYLDKTAWVEGLESLFAKSSKEQIEKGFDTNLYFTNEDFEKANNAFRMQLGEDSVISTKSGIYKDYFDAANKVLAEKGVKYRYQGFATGASYIPYDNYPALLHTGEIVLNANDAESYRQLVGKISIQTLANNLGNAEIEVIPVALVSNMDNTLTVISTDIKTIIAILQTIEMRMPQGVAVGGNNSVYPEGYSSYETAITGLNDR